MMMFRIALIATVLVAKQSYHLGAALEDFDAAQASAVEELVTDENADLFNEMVVVEEAQQNEGEEEVVFSNVVTEAINPVMGASTAVAVIVQDPQEDDSQETERQLACSVGPGKQCGGKGYGGCKTCQSGYVCKYKNVWWNDCQKKSTSGGTTSSRLPRRSYKGNVPSMYKNVQVGHSTYFGAGGTGGACGYDQPPRWLPSWVQNTASVNNNDPNKFWPVSVASNVWQGSKACGTCLAAVLDSNQQKYYGYFTGVRFGVIYDTCPGCPSSALDWRGSGNGNFKTQWIAIECPTDRGQTNFLYYSATVQDYYMKFQVRNTRAPIKSARIRFKGHGWMNLNFPPDRDNYFVAYCGGYCSKSFDIELHSQFGDVVTDYGVHFSGDLAYGGTQFPSKDY